MANMLVESTRKVLPLSQEKVRYWTCGLLLPGSALAEAAVNPERTPASTSERTSRFISPHPPVRTPIAANRALSAVGRLACRSLGGAAFAGKSRPLPLPGQQPEFHIKPLAVLR